MYPKNIILFISIMILCAACGVKIVDENNFTATPDFVTAVLPPIPILPLPATQTVIPPIAIPTISPIEGTTTTQINVRAEPSTASQSLGLIGPFVKVQVIGKDASGSWYKIIYVESTTGYGWIRAEYVQVNAPTEIPLVEASAGSGSAVSGLVIQKINVRNGPGTEYESLGVLNPNDVVFITGKDPSGAWMRIEFASAPNGMGWAAVEFLQVSSSDSLPIIGEKEQPTSVASTPATMFMSAAEDGDSMQAPLATISFSPTNARALQIQGDVSSPNGDIKDWIQFSASGNVVAIEVMCVSNALQMELWDNGFLVNTFLLPCEDKQTLNVTPQRQYFLSLSESSTGEIQYTSYTLILSIPR